VASNLDDTFQSYRDKFINAVERLISTQKLNYPLLIKPNAGGFGKGIRLIYSLDELPSLVESLYYDDDFIASDRVVLVQEYIQPFQDKVYRVWFLDGKVQCAVERSFSSELVNQIPDPTQDRLNAFTGGCAGSSDGSCSLDDIDSLKDSSQVTFSLDLQTMSTESSPWPVPDNIATEIETLLTCVGDDCYAGSVEFLFNRDEDHRVYFDLNMLSTLPVESDKEWINLAHSILRVALGEEKSIE